MRWDNLFDDLEGQLELELGAEELDLVAEEERLRLGRLSLRDRLMALCREPVSPEARGVDPVRLTLRTGETIAVTLSAGGRDWIAGTLSDAGSRRLDAVVPLAAITAVLPTPAQLAHSIRPDTSNEPAVSLSARLGLTFVLRDLCRRRAGVDLLLPGLRVHGTIDRVGRDHLDLAEHEPGAARRESSVVRTRIVPLEELLMVRL